MACLLGYRCPGRRPATDKGFAKKPVSGESFHRGGTSKGVMSDPKADFERLLADMRPKLHRYCARMTGSVIDGEDVLQETLIKAIEAFPHTGPLANAEGWLFRIAHNAAMDFLRRRSRQQGMQSDA